MNYHKTTLSNGLRVITVPMPSSESVTLTVWCHVGSRFEPEKIAGLSHFLEHMTFKGSKKRPTARETSTAVDAIGGEFNASTSKEWTNFYIKAAVANLETAFDVLSDMVLNPLIKEEEVKREKGVILEEKAMYEDTPIMDINEVFENLIFKGNTLDRHIVGTQKAIKNMTRKDFLVYRSTHYFPKNMLITVAGGVKESQVLNLIKKYFTKTPSNNKKETVKKYISKQTRPQVKLKTKKIEQAHLIIGFLGSPLGHPDRFAQSVLSVILGAGMSSRLFIEVRERRGLAYSIHTNIEHYTDTGYIATYAGVDLKKVDEAIKVILAEHYAIADKIKKISANELKKAKEYIKGHLALALENTSVVNAFFAEQELLLGRIETPEDVYKAVDKVTVDDVIRVAKKLFVKQKLNLAMIGPYNKPEKFERLLK